VSLRLFVIMRLHIVELTIGSMAVGLGMAPEEWEELKGNVDDSFWVMRIIGSWIFLPWSLWSNAEYQMAGSGYPPLPNDHDGFSCGAHKSVFTFHHTNHHPLTTRSTSRDYGCLTYE
jgi:hypothetical protein